jgi:hypothetical protein
LGTWQRLPDESGTKGEDLVRALHFHFMDSFSRLHLTTSLAKCLAGSDPPCDTGISGLLFSFPSPRTSITKAHNPFVPNQPSETLHAINPIYALLKISIENHGPNRYRFGPFCFLCRRQDYIIRNKTGLLSHANVKRKAGFGFTTCFQKSPQTRKKQTKGEQKYAHRK